MKQFENKTKFIWKNIYTKLENIMIDNEFELILSNL